MSGNVVKLNSRPTEVGLNGAELIAFNAVCGTLQGAIAGNTKRNLWGSFVSTVHAATQGLPLINALKAAEDIYNATKTAIRSKAVKEALATAGYGAFDSMVAEDGKEKFTKTEGQALAAKYGANFRLGKNLDKAETTVTQYYNNIKGAIEFNVPDWWTLTVSQVTAKTRELRDAREPERLKERAADEAATSYGGNMAALYKKSLGTPDEAVLNLFNGVLQRWTHVPDDDKTMLLDMLTDLAINAERREAESKQEIGQTQDEHALRELNDDDAGERAEVVAA